MCCIHTTEYYSAFKTKGILTPATTWMDLGNIMLNETSQAQKDQYYLLPLT